MSGFMRGDSGVGAPGTHAFVPDMTTSAVVSIPAWARYFKSDVATTVRVQLSTDAASIDLPVVAGTNIEDVAFLFNPSAISTVKLVFLG